MRSKVKVPEQITNAVNTILLPYGVTLDSFDDSHQQNDEVRYLTIENAEKYCGVSRWTIYRAVKSGKLPQIKLSASKQGKVLLDRTDIDKWLKGLKCKRTSR